MPGRRPNWFYTLGIIALTMTLPCPTIRVGIQITTTVKSTMNQLVSSFNKDIILAETGYLSLGWNDWTNNIVGLSEHLIPSYPATAKDSMTFNAARKTFLK